MPATPTRRLLPKLGARAASSLAHCAGRHHKLPRSYWPRTAQIASARQLCTRPQPAAPDGGGPSGHGLPPLFALATTDSKYLDTSFAARLFCKLELSSFSEAELRGAFERTDTGGTGQLSREEIRAMLLHEEQGRVCPRMLESQVEATTAHLLSAAPSGLLPFGEFKEKITALAERRDPRIWPIAASMLLSGTAVGVVLPVMPMLVHHLGLSQAEYGYVVAAFGLAKLVGNVPAATLVDRHGRRALLASGLAVTGVGMVGVGLAGSLEQLVAARLVSGLGVSFLLAGATMAVADISTPLNRARMMAPMTTAFSAGTVLGPAVGGVLCSALGVAPTFGVVGALFGANALATRLLTSETMPAHMRGGGGGGGSGTAGGGGGGGGDGGAAAGGDGGSMFAGFAATATKWRPLLADPELQPLLLLNGAYWISLAGTPKLSNPNPKPNLYPSLYPNPNPSPSLTQRPTLTLTGANMTLLPLMLAGDKFALSAAEIGGCFAVQSLISVLGAAPSAALADRVGPRNVIAPGLAISASAMMAFPLAQDMPQALAVLCVWAAGGTFLGSAPTASVANLVPPASRAPALALMRTVGDLGLFAGATTVGGLAAVHGSDLAMQGTSVFLFASAGAFLVRTRLR